MTLSLNGRVVETPFLHSSAQVEQANLKATESFLSELQKVYRLEKDDTGLALEVPQFLNVNKDYPLTRNDTLPRNCWSSESCAFCS